VASCEHEGAASGDQGIEERIRIVFAKRHIDDRAVDVTLRQLQRLSQIVRRADRHMTEFGELLLASR
jgi:hypothetical protein